MLKAPNKPPPPKIATLIGSNTTLTGEVHFQGGLHVDGHIHGNLVSDGEHSLMIISPTASVEGEIHGHEVVINGRVQGDVYALGRLELGETAQVTGDVYYGAITVAIGATVNGRLVHRPGEPKLIEHRQGPGPD
jgi:cytoskeletal protein CcmA (bactofilin family)